MRRPDRQELAKQDEEQRTERVTEEAAHSPDHHHRDELARERHGERLCRREAMVEHRQCACDCDHGRGQHEADQLVAIGRIADEARALLVLADRHQNAAGRRAVEAPEQVTHGHADRRDDPIVDVVGFEIELEHRRAGHAAQSALASGELGPAVTDGEQQRGQGKREQREIDAAPPENQRSGDERGPGNENNREQEGKDVPAGKPVPLTQRRGIGAESEPGAVTERDEAGVADQHIESHAGNGERHHID